uniref:Uncharacterized protein LOC114332188 n=1 Tax=Diabrotica virgifera virgifera TaxID=50390 RepID=A0A6P7FSF7_DIAVI
MANRHTSRVPVRLSMKVKIPEEHDPNKPESNTPLLQRPSKNFSEYSNPASEAVKSTDSKTEVGRPSKNLSEVSKSTDTKMVIERPSKNLSEYSKPASEAPKSMDTKTDAVSPTANKATQLLRSLSVKAKTQIQPQSYLKNVRFRKNSIGYRGAMLNIHKYKAKATSCPDIYKNSMATLFREDEVQYTNFVLLVLLDGH